MRRVPPHDESAEDVTRRATTNLALLIQLASAEQLAERGGTNPELDADAWYAIEEILITTRNDVQRLNTEIEQRQREQRARPVTGPDPRD